MPTPAETMIELLTQTRDAVNRLAGEMRMDRRRAAGPREATDAELANKHGDPDVKFSAKGLPPGEPDTKGRKLSTMSPATLRVLASTFDYFADQADAEGTLDTKGRPKSMWEARNAALARGWLRKKTAPAMPTTTGKTPPKNAGDSWEEEDEPAPTPDVEEDIYK